METNNSKKHIYLEYIIAFLLAFCGGYTDAYTLIYRGGLFSFMQTGNLVKFIIAITDGRFELSYLLPIILFCLGVIVVAILNKEKDRSILILSIISIVLLASGFLPDTNISNIISICLLSVIGSMQFQAFRKCNDIYYTSTMCTNNMRLLSEGIVKYIDNKNDKRFIFFLLVIISFSIGVLVSSLLGKLLTIYTISLLPIITVIIMCLYIHLLKITPSKQVEVE